MDIKFLTQENEIQKLYSQFGLVVPVGDLETGKTPAIQPLPAQATQTSVTFTFNVMSGAEITGIEYKVNDGAAVSVTPQKGIVTIELNSLAYNSGPYEIEFTVTNENGDTSVTQTADLVHYTDWAEPSSVLKGNKFIAEGEEMTGTIETKGKNDIRIVENKVTVPSGYFASSVEVTAGSDPKGTKTITANGTGIDVKDYAAVDVAVPASAVVSGTKSITENGEGIDVTNYAAVDVAVPSGGIGDGGIVVENAVAVEDGGSVAINLEFESYSMFDLENHDYSAIGICSCGGGANPSLSFSSIIDNGGGIEIDPIYINDEMDWCIDMSDPEPEYSAYLYIFEDSDVSCPLYIVPFTFTVDTVNQ